MAKVQLIAKTCGVGEEIKDADTSEVLAYVARVSNPQNQTNHATAGKLLAYCLKHKHWSVFETVSMTFEIETSRAIAAQILRHRSANFQEFSQRYQSVDEFIIHEARRQDTKNRQNSIDDMSEEDKKWWREVQEGLFEQIKRTYSAALNKGIAKEVARMILPMATKTRLYMTANIRTWITYCMVRCDPSTQKEHRDIAQQIKEILLQEIPILKEALEEC